MSDQDNLNNLSNDLSSQQLLDLFTALNKNSPSYTFNSRPDIKKTQEAIMKFATSGKQSTSMALEEIKALKQQQDDLTTKQDDLTTKQDIQHKTFIQFALNTKTIFTGMKNISTELTFLGGNFSVLQETFINATNGTLILQNYSENATDIALEEVTENCLERVTNPEIKICMLDAKINTVYTLPDNSEYIFAYKFVSGQFIQAAVVESCQSFSLTIEEVKGQDDYGNDITTQVTTEHNLMLSGDYCMMGDSAS